MVLGCFPQPAAERNLRYVMLAVVLFVGCLVACAAALNLGQFVDDAVAVVWAAVAIVWAAAAVDGVWPAAAAAVIECVAVTACLGVDSCPGFAVAQVHVAL